MKVAFPRLNRQFVNKFPLEMITIGLSAIYYWLKRYMDRGFSYMPQSL